MIPTGSYFLMRRRVALRLVESAYDQTDCEFMASADVTLTNIVVRFRRKIVLNDVSCHIPSGSLLGIRGSNGAGKTTLLRLLANTYRPHSGVRVGPSRCAYVPAIIEAPPLAAKTWIAGVPRRSRVDARPALDVLGFDGDLSTACRGLSFGNLRKLLLAEAFSSGDVLIVVDEVSAGLDDVGLAGVRTLIGQARSESKTVILADQESRPFPVGTSVVRVTDGVLEAKQIDDRTEIVTFSGPSNGYQLLVDQAREIGFTLFEEGG